MTHLFNGRTLERDGRMEILRQRELATLERNLRQQEYILVSSTPQCGLSIFLKQASEYIRDIVDLRDYEPIFWETPHWKGSLFVNLAAQIANRFLKTVKDEKSRIRRFEKIETDRGVETLFKSAFGKSQKNVVVFIDDFHTLPLERQKQFVALVRQLHTYRGNSPFLKKLLFVIGGNLKWKRIDPDRTSPFSNAASKIFLRDFDREETVFFLNHYFSQRGVTLREVTLNYLYELTLGHPHFLQVLAKILGTHRGGPPSFFQIDRALHTLLEEGDYHLRSIREALLDYSEEDLEPLFSILQGEVIKRSSLFPNPRVDNLLLLGILSVSSDNTLSLRNPIYSKFLRSDPPLREKFSNRVAPSSALNYPLVAASKEGFCLLNRLENRIRNFLVSQLHKKFGESWAEKGLGGIQTEPERDALQNKVLRELDQVLNLRREKEEKDFPLSTQDNPLLSYATMKELELVVVKNWRGIFRPFIGSQEQFKVYLTALNRIRNKLAHNRLITDQELDKLGEIELNFRKWLGTEF